MRLLIDSCVGMRTQAALRAAGHDLVVVAKLGTDPGDAHILARAVAEQRVVVTKDKDFGELIFKEKQEHCGVVQLIDVSIATQAQLCVQVLQKHEPELLASAIITV